jgi:hypothetical protein
MLVEGDGERKLTLASGFAVENFVLCLCPPLGNATLNSFHGSIVSIIVKLRHELVFHSELPECYSKTSPRLEAGKRIVAHYLSLPLVSPTLLYRRAAWCTQFATVNKDPSPPPPAVSLGRLWEVIPLKLAG